MFSEFDECRNKTRRIQIAGFIKPQVSRLVDFCISHNRERFAEELFYDSKQRCMYVRCYGFQFNFHNITISKTIDNFARSALNIPVE